MPQNGFHGLVGLATARMFGRRAAPSIAEPLVTGIVLGAMLPDIDMYPTSIAVLLKRPDLIYVIHRSLTHSVFAALAVAIVGVLVVSRYRIAAWALWGLAIGISTHILLDICFWFAPIDLFWPLSHLPADRQSLPVLNLWTGVEVPNLFVNVREAFEFAAFALMVHALRKIAGPEKTRGMVAWERAMWGFFALALVTAYVFRDNPSRQNYVVTTPYLLVFLPYVWWQVWKLRAEITSWCLRGRDAVPSASSR